MDLHGEDGHFIGQVLQIRIQYITGTVLVPTAHVSLAQDQEISCAQVWAPN